MPGDVFSIDLQGGLAGYLGEQPDAVSEAAFDASWAVGENMRGTAQELAPTGADARLRVAIKIEPTEEIGATVGIHEGTVVEGELVDYARAVEEGRDPGSFPPTHVGSGLWRWVQRKLGVAGPEAEEVAFMVGRKIEREGTAAQPYMGPAFEQHKNDYPEEFEKAYDPSDAG